MCICLKTINFKSRYLPCFGGKSSSSVKIVQVVIPQAYARFEAARQASKLVGRQAAVVDPVALRDQDTEYFDVATLLELQLSW